MSYAAAGLGLGAASGLGSISQGLLGIDQDEMEKRKLAMEMETQRQNAERLQLQTAADDAENGITRGFTPTQVKLGDATIGAGGVSGSAFTPPGLLAGAKLRGPGGVMPTGAPSPLAIGGGGQAPSSVMAGQRPGLAGPSSKPMPLDVPNRAAFDQPLASTPDVTFKTAYAEVDPTKGLAYQRTVAAQALKDQHDAAEKERIRQEEAPQRAALVQQLPANLQGAGAALDLASLRDLVVKVGTKDPKAPKDPVNWTYDAERGIQINPETGQVRQLPGVSPKGTGATGGIPGVDKLPTTAQSAISSIQGVRDSIGNYRALVDDYLKVPALTRAKAQMGVPGTGLDAKLGALQAAQAGLQLQIKNLAQLGQISSGDQAFLNNLVGTATSKSALYRDPGYITSRIDELQKYIDTAVSGYEGTYGVKIPGGAPQKAASPDTDIDAMIRAGMSDEEIARKLRGG